MRRLLIVAGAVAVLAACTQDRPVRVLQADGTEVLVSVANRTARPALRNEADDGGPPVRAMTAPTARMAEAAGDTRPAADEEAADDPVADEGRQLVAALPPAAAVVTAEAVRAAPDPAGLMGRPAEVVKAALGDASLLRREPPAQVWQYRTAACVLDVVFYPEGAQGVLQVAHVAYRPVEGERIDGKTCAAHVLARTPGRD